MENIAFRLKVLSAYAGSSSWPVVYEFAITWRYSSLPHTIGHHRQAVTGLLGLVALARLGHLERSFG